MAARHPIAVMIDDLGPARPQSGFTSASIVWQAPAEGGIPRYMLMFADQVPGNVGPVRSSRYYFIAWAAEWKAAYAHAGGSPQALTTLRLQGQGQLVYNVDQFRFGPPYFVRVTNRFAPHNLYTTGKELLKLAAKVGATAPAGPPPGRSRPMRRWRVGRSAARSASPIRPIGSTTPTTAPRTRTSARSVVASPRSMPRATSGSPRRTWS